MAGRGKSWSRNAGIQFPVGRIVCFLKADKYANWLGVATLVYLTVVLEYLMVKVLELAENVARDNNKTHIVSRHVQLAMCNDEELVKLLGSVTITSDDILPNIHNLLPKESFAKSATPVVDDV